MVALLVIGGTWKKDTTNKKRERERDAWGKLEELDTEKYRIFQGLCDQ